MGSKKLGKIPKTVRLDPPIVKTLHNIVEKGYVDLRDGQRVLIKPSITEVIEQGIIAFAKEHKAKVYRRCIYMSEAKGKQVFCSKFNKYKDLEFCINVCNFWINVPEKNGWGDE